MSYLLDTNVISELLKPESEPRVVRWFDAHAEDDLFLSVVTIAEIRYGIERLPVGKRRERAEAWLELELVPRFERRLLPASVPVAQAWGRLVATAEASGRTLTAMDGLIAATAYVEGLDLVTRNVSDFDFLLERVTNPWVD